MAAGIYVRYIFLLLYNTYRFMVDFIDAVVLILQCDDVRAHPSDYVNGDVELPFVVPTDRNEPCHWNLLEYATDSELKEDSSNCTDPMVSGIGRCPPSLSHSSH